MAHMALYRTWRPQTFRDIVGQKHIVQTLQNSLKEGRITHAYLFSGPRGTGKTSAAKILAKAVNCQQSSAVEPCNACSACIGITEGSVLDVVEIDAASNNGVDEIRDIRDKVKYAPTEVRYKVYIIDEVHMLTTGAFNALLKTLEEPPAHVMFILATTEPHKLPVTIISRCQRYDFHRVQLYEQVSRLELVCNEEGFTVDKEALEYIARLSDGGMRDALSLLDQIISFTGNPITYTDVLAITGGMGSRQLEDVADSILQKDISRALQLIEGFMQQGKSTDKCMEDLIYFFRDLLVIQMVPQDQAKTERVSDSPELRELAAKFDRNVLFRIIEILNHYQGEMKYSSQPQTLFEISVMKVCSLDEPISAIPQQAPAELATLIRKVKQLEQQVAELQKNGILNTDGQTLEAGAKAGFGDRRPTPSSAALKKRPAKFDDLIQHQDKSEFKQIVSKWTQVLNQVKVQKITVHAWLVDGEPVSATADTVLLAFKSNMHRENTERSAHREIIEQAMTEILGSPFKLSTIMLKDWKEAQAEGEATQPTEELVLEPEEPGKYKEEWIKEAIDLFGEQLVVIKDE